MHPTVLQDFTQNQTNYIHGLAPAAAIQLSSGQVLQLLAQRLGTNTMMQALNSTAHVPSPLIGVESTDWIKRVNMVGVNVRTIQSFWNVVKYALTLPGSQSSVHLLPIWEPGVVASLYGMASWQINPEFYSTELAHLVPQLNTVEKQLKAVVNLLHALGKTVGMDVIPHTDRYAEMVLAQPQYFEWLRRVNLRILDHRADLHQDAQLAILAWLQVNGPAQSGYQWSTDPASFFGTDLAENERLAILFGAPDQHQARQNRRASLVDWLYRRGLEPVPATMAPPYRGLEVDPDPAAKTIDFAGREWRDYRITAPQEMSRVFGPLTRYKLYSRLDNNSEWAIDFKNPRTEVWDYICNQYAAVQKTYNIDFMRGDMSHVQMRAEGVPAEPDRYYDPLRAVRDHIRQSVPYFAYFAESFLAPPNYMTYGNEVDHLVASHADSTLGDLQSMVVGEERFRQNFADYWAILKSKSVAPNFTLMTGDKDDPRFDKFYLHGNITRLFIGLGCTDMPSYMGLGFEQRDRHIAPAPNEHYTKLYVFQIDKGPKATYGPYEWGQNLALFKEIDRLRQFVESIWEELTGTTTHWLLGPETSAECPVLVWTQSEQARYLFAANLSGEAAHKVEVTIPKSLAVSQVHYQYKQVKYNLLTDTKFELELGPEGLIVLGSKIKISS